MSLPLWDISSLSHHRDGADRTSLSSLIPLISLIPAPLWYPRYEAQKLCINTYIRYCSNQNTTSWTLPPLYQLLRDLQTLSSNATSEFQRVHSHPHPNSIASASASGASASGAAGELKYEEDCARVFQAAFKLCVSDRTNPQGSSKRKGVYRMANLCLGWYFKVGLGWGRGVGGLGMWGEIRLIWFDFRRRRGPTRQIDRTNLSKQLVRAVNADPTIPPLEQYKMCDKVTWRYYLGLLAFRAGEDGEADEHLGWAFERCLAGSRRNQEWVKNVLEGLGFGGAVRRILIGGWIWILHFGFWTLSGLS